MPIIPNIIGELTRECLIYIQGRVSGNVASVVSNIRGGGHVNLALTMTAEERTVTANQALFQRYTSIDRAIKNPIFMEVQKVFLSSIIYQLTGFGQVTVLQILKHLFRLYGAID